MQIGQFTIDVVVDLSKLRTQLAQIQIILDPLNKSMKEFTTATKAVDVAARASAESFVRVRDRAKEASGTTANLGRAVRELTTSFLGTSIAAIALGTAIGNLATQAISQLLLAVKESITQFADLQNQLAEVAGVGSNAAATFSLIEDVSRISNRSLKDLTESYKQLAAQAAGTRVTIDEVNQIFRQYETRLASIQQQTLVSAFKDLLSAIGGVIAGLDKMLNVSNLIIGALNLIAIPFKFIRDTLRGGGGNTINSSLEETTNILRTTQLRLTDITSRMGTVNENSLEWLGLSLQQAKALQDIARLGRERNRLEQEHTAATAPTSQQMLQRRSTLADLTAELRHQVQIGTENIHQQQILNRLFQIANEIRQSGRPLNADENMVIRQNVIDAAAATQFNSLRDSLISQEQLEMESNARRLSLLRDISIARITSQQEVNALLEAENFRHSQAVAQIQVQQAQIGINAAIAAANSISQVLALAGQKNKALLKASIAINTAVAVAQAYMANEAAAMQALAVPPAPNWGYYGAVKAFGAIQIAGIIAAGALQIGAAGKGGGGGGGSSGGGTTQPQENELTPPQRIVIESVDPAAIFTGAQLNGLIEAINAQAENGRVVIASKLIS